jgi:orotidine-5'-phosphate decarboxylase
VKSFPRRFGELLEEKGSILCIGLDPALASQRKENVIPQRYMNNAKGDRDEVRLKFCFDIVEQTSKFAIAAKPNEQYVRGWSSEHHRRLTKCIHEHGLLAIYDCKLGDIADTAESNLFWMHEWEYDAITVHTQPGNLGHIVKVAHGYSPPIGIIALTLMSNPEAIKYMKQSRYDNKPVYLAIAEDVRSTDADGCVVGATGHVTEEEVMSIRGECGEDKIFLVPGIGTQRGDPEKVIRAGGKNILINVGRDIIYSPDPKGRAEYYYRLLVEIVRMYGK